MVSTCGGKNGIEGETRGWQLWNKKAGPVEKGQQGEAENITDHKITDTKGMGIPSHAPAPGPRLFVKSRERGKCGT